MTSVRSAHRGIGMVTAVAAAVLVTLLAGCSSSGSSATAAAAAGPTDLAKAKAVLAQSRTELHNVIDSLAGSTNLGAKAPFTACAGGKNGIPPAACTGYDAPAPCATQTESGPQRWGYNVNLHVNTPDALASGNAVLNVLQGSQWKATRRPTSANVLDVQAVKNGMTIRVVADDLPGVINIEGYGPCVSAAGTAING